LPCALYSLKEMRRLPLIRSYTANFKELKSILQVQSQIKISGRGF
jgi:hypothetical protein